LTDEMRGELRTLSQKSWKYDSADCLLCQRSFGYRCPDSPDTVCHYYTESVPFTAQNGVRLVTGEFVDYPEGHDVENETDDQCIFCGQPEERK
jgi:hypothetical protein